MPRKGPKQRDKGAVPSVRGVTFQQYEKGYEMFRAGSTEGKIKAATRMSQSQLKWCALTGDSEAGMVNWVTRLEGEATALRTAAIDAMKDTGQRTAEVLKKQIDLRKRATDTISVLFNSFLQYTVAPVLKEAETTGELDQDDLVMSPGLRETMKVLRPLASMTDVSNTFNGIFKPILARENDRLSRQAQQGLDNKALMPAAISLVEEAKSAGDVGLDPVEELMGAELEKWSAEEKQRFLETGEAPPPEAPSLSALVGDVLDVESSEPSDDEEVLAD